MRTLNKLILGVSLVGLLTACGKETSDISDNQRGISVGEPFGKPLSEFDQTGSMIHVDVKPVAYTEAIEKNVTAYGTYHRSLEIRPVLSKNNEVTGFDVWAKVQGAGYTDMENDISRLVYEDVTKKYK